MQIERNIAADPATVWRYVSDVAHWDELLPTFNEVDRLGAVRPTEVGSRFRVRQPGLAAAVYEVTRWTHGEQFVWESQALGVRTVADHRLEATSSGTLLTLRLDWRGPLAGLVRLLFGGKSMRYLQIEAATFAALAEAETHRVA